MIHSLGFEKPQISVATIKELRKQMRCWDSELEEFRRAHHCGHASLDPLYAIPADLFRPFNHFLPTFFDDREAAFEIALSALCQRNGCIGIFHNLPIRYKLLQSPPVLSLSDWIVRALRWERFGTLSNIRASIGAATGRLDEIKNRLCAYTGWLVTNPLFRAERDCLKSKWAEIVEFIQREPTYPLRRYDEPGYQKPAGSYNVVDDFIKDFNSFYDRWELKGMTSWDLPEPWGAQLIGTALSSDLCPPSKFICLQISPVLRLPSSLSLHEIIAGAQKARIEAAKHEASHSHLQDWLDVLDQNCKDDLSFRRFRQIFEIMFYRDTILGSRYSDRFAGNIERIDLAFAQYFGNRSDDSVKKLRTQIAKRLLSDN